MYASAQPLDFLAATKNPSFPTRKLASVHPEFPDGPQLPRIIHEDFYCNRQLHVISSRTSSLRFDVLQVHLQGNSLRLA